MLDLDLIRKDRAATAAALAKRLDAAEVERALSAIVELDASRRDLVGRIAEEQRKRKEAARAYAAAKRASAEPLPPPEDTKALLASLEEQLTKVEAELREEMSALPNLPADDVVAGGKESNRVLREWGTKPTLSPVVDHTTVAKEYGLVDFDRGTKLGGAGYWMYTGYGARLEWALLNWFIDQHIAAGYTFLLPPHMLLESAGFAAGQFPKFRDDVYHIANPDSHRPQFLLPTSETAILGAHQDEIFAEGDLPHRAFAYTPCYRRERAGAHSDERGTVRGHQFNKVEIFQFTTPEGAPAAFDAMVRQAESLLEGLGLHYRTSLLAAGDASASMRKTLDVEVWMPHVGGYKEVSSVSWAGDYQARRAAIRYRPAQGKTKFLHTLNGSALATSRILPAILEQHQQEDGSVLVPEVLRDRVGTDRLVRPKR
ncbi:serine--tRNA ligase [Streptomyces sp. MBT56]|uniref:serine--tRNA ligase n=1 Tax=Streptomyces TaxID=1883 RepID=UPI00190CCA4E|nr:MULTISPECIES: serine--tRNA ligase [unclassified Streptomyces]MBK3560653.1 serine--tRNA ligase [Streptomyces sp. MBT56]MBK3602503.1 serine--tRNA ligase [Streptomyces sp. MBT54]MBK3615460.1 serine--tRNA ligase [Streptomyces sp. MBT98]MBK6044907.1 serine--tRNA ligase [Streptomyces sp. MBT55]